MARLDIKDLVINKKRAVYFIDIKDKDKLQKQLRSLTDDGTLEKYNTTYTYTIYDEYIALVFYEPFEFSRY